MSSRYICPVCRSPRHVQLSDSLGTTFHLRLLLGIGTAAAVAFLLQGWESALMVSLLHLPVWSVAEFVHWARIRQAAKCGTCDFDPILYQKNWKAARARVENRLKTLEQNQIAKLREEMSRSQKSAGSASP